MSDEITWESTPTVKEESSKKNPIRERVKKNTVKSAPTPAQAEKLCEPLPDLYRMLGVGISAFDDELGFMIAENADRLGNSWIELAKNSPGFRRFLQRLGQANGWGAVISAHAPIAIAVAYKYIPKSDESETSHDPWDETPDVDEMETA